MLNLFTVCVKQNTNINKYEEMQTRILQISDPQL